MGKLSLMNKQKILQSLKNKISDTLSDIKKIPETLRFCVTRDKVLLNVLMRLKNNKVEHRNFGDELNYYLVKSLINKPLFNLPCILVKNRRNYLVIGSIIETYANKDSIIWGSGAMFGGERILNEKPKKVLAVRGPLTREYLLSQGVDCPEVYGDPALLLPLVYQPKVGKRYKLGVIPHFVDINSEYLSELKNDPEVKVIKLKGYEEWHKVIDEICECEYVVSSSLHGLIISDAYGVPNMWIRLSNKILGGNFKFHDYFMSVGRDLREPLLIKHTVIKEELLVHKKKYTPIAWDSEELLKVAPFQLNIKRSCNDCSHG